MKLLPIISAALLAITYSLTPAAEAADQQATAQHKHRQASSDTGSASMKIRLTIDDHSTTATLVDSPTSRDFLTLLPLTLTLEDYAVTEKIAYLPRKLSKEGAPAGIDPSAGDLTYYAPWGNLALFYRDFGYAKGLIKLGSIDGGMEIFNSTGEMTVTIEVIQQSH